MCMTEYDRSRSYSVRTNLISVGDRMYASQAIDHFMVCHLFSLISVWKNWVGNISAPGSYIHVYV